MTKTLNKKDTNFNHTVFTNLDLKNYVKSNQIT